MSAALPLLSATTGDAVVAWEDGTPIGAHAFVATALRLAARLPSDGGVLVLCENRTRFALALCACACAGVEAVLPPARNSAALEAAVGRHRAVLALVDAGSAPTPIPSLAVDDAFAAHDNFHVPSIPAERVVATLFTSGSTGTPASHSKTWGSLVRGARSLAARIAFPPGAAVIGCVPPQHMWGLEATVMLPLLAGGALHPALPLLPRDIAACLAAVPAPRWLVLTPLHVRSVLGSVVALPGLAGALCATAPLAAAEARDFESRTKAPLVEIYGSTETGVAGTRRTAVERTFALLAGIEAVAGAHGTTFRGGHLDGEVRLSDRIRRVGEGRFELAGRDGDMVKIGGKRGSLAGVALAIKRIPGVVDAVCVLDEGGGRLTPRLAALVVAPGLDADAIRRALRERVDTVFIPRRLHVVEALPRNAIGKLGGDALTALLRAHDERGTDERTRA